MIQENIGDFITIIERYDVPDSTLAFIQFGVLIGKTARTDRGWVRLDPMLVSPPDNANIYLPRILYVRLELVSLVGFYHNTDLIPQV
jgi:hypothetical protein